jgi:hypothetical protein
LAVTLKTARNSKPQKRKKIIMENAAKTSQPQRARSERQSVDATPAELGGSEPTPFALPLKVDREAYKNIVIHDAQWRRVAAFPKTRAGLMRANQLVDAVNAHAALCAGLRAVQAINQDSDLDLEQIADRLDRVQVEIRACLALVDNRNRKVE